MAAVRASADSAPPESSARSDGKAEEDASAESSACVCRERVKADTATHSAMAASGRECGGSRGKEAAKGEFPRNGGVEQSQQGMLEIIKLGYDETRACAETLVE